jgi:L-alanine-DL-glutamate epimerase-like enolase superfamily enzyme
VTARSGPGTGWTYSAPAAAVVIHDKLADAVRDRDAHDIAAGWAAMHRACRNLGTKGLVMQAISAVDMAWWDLKARLLNMPISTLLGQCRSECRSTAPAGSPA